MHTPTRPSWIARAALWLRQHVRTQWKSYGLNLLVLLAALLLVQAWQTRHVPSQLDMHTPVTLLGADGQYQHTTIAQWRSRHGDAPIALYFWASWCPICRLEEPTLDSLQRSYPVLSIAMQSGSAAEVQRHLQQRQLHWATVVDTAGTLARAAGVSGVPTFVVLDHQGRLRLPTVGYTTGLGMRVRLLWARIF